MTKISFLIITIPFCLLVVSQSIAGTSRTKKSKNNITSVSGQKVKFLKAVDQKYRDEQGIIADFKMTAINNDLGLKKLHTGQMWVQGGKMRVEYAKPNPMVLVVDGEFFWFEQSPLGNIKGEKTFVRKLSMNSLLAKKLDWVRLLAGGGILKVFNVVGVEGDKKELKYFLQPGHRKSQFKRAQIVVDLKTKIIKSLRFWNEADAESFFEFSNTKFKVDIEKSDKKTKNVEKKIFKYIPPPGAEIIGS